MHFSHNIPPNPFILQPTVGTGRSTNGLLAYHGKARSHLTNRRGWRGQRFGLETRREEGASPQWGCDRRATKYPAQRSAAPTRFSWLFLPVSCFLPPVNAAAGICEM